MLAAFYLYEASGVSAHATYGFLNLLLAGFCILWLTISAAGWRPIAEVSAPDPTRNTHDGG